MSLFKLIKGKTGYKVYGHQKLVKKHKQFYADNFYTLDEMDQYTER